MLLVWGGSTAIIISILTGTNPSGAETPRVPPAIRCVTALTVQFFLVYLGLRMGISITDTVLDDKAISSGERGKFVDTFYAAQATVHLCPMLAVIFMALRMRVQQISGKDGAPQGWAQDSMYLCTWSVFAQLCVCLFIGCATDSTLLKNRLKLISFEEEDVKSDEGETSIIEK